jgi:hypothetical protein
MLKSFTKMYLYFINNYKCKYICIIIDTFRDGVALVQTDVSEKRRTVSIFKII